MKKLVLLLLVSAYSLHPMESPKKLMPYQQPDIATGMVIIRSLAIAITANHMRQPTITPIPAEELASALGARSNPHDKHHYLKILQIVASLLHQQDELLQIIDHYQEALTLRALIDERIMLKESVETAGTADLDIQRELLKHITQLTIAFTKKDASAFVAACRTSITAFTTAPHVLLNPTMVEELGKAQEVTGAIIKKAFDETLHTVKSFVPHFEAIKPLKACYGYFYPFAQTMSGAVAFMGEVESITELEDTANDTKNISKIASAFDIAGLHTWHINNKIALHQLYNFILKELAQLPHGKTYSKSLFDSTLMLTPFADGTIADGTIADGTIADGISTSVEKEPALTETERSCLAMELIAEFDTHKKTLKEKHAATTRKKGRKHSSPTASSSSSSSSASSSRDATPELDSDSEVEETASTEFDPESAFVKSALASRCKEKSSSPTASSPTASSSSADNPFLYKDRTMIWQKSSWLKIAAEMTSRGHTTPYAQFHGLAYHRLPFVLEHVFENFAQHTSYTSPKSNRNYDVLCFDGAVIVDDAVFHDKFIAGKTIYGTFEISCSRNTPIVVHRHFRPYTAESIVGERPIDTHGKTRTQNCMGHRYTITENAQNILIQEPTSPVNVTYVIFKTTF